MPFRNVGKLNSTNNKSEISSNWCVEIPQWKKSFLYVKVNVKQETRQVNEDKKKIAK